MRIAISYVKLYLEEFNDFIFQVFSLKSKGRESMLHLIFNFKEISMLRLYMFYNNFVKILFIMGIELAEVLPLLISLSTKW